MALISPGQQITVTDESQYVPGAVGSVPLVILATAQDKLNPSSGAATGTTKANAGKLQVFASQRELVTAMGYPVFQQSSAGTPLNGDERNEYGLLAAYSALGISNRVYAIRADIDLNQLTPTAVRPLGAVADGTYWFDLGDTDWGINEWDASTGTFTKKTALFVDSGLVAVGEINYPPASVGDIGSYAVTVGQSGSTYLDSVWYIFKKLRDNTWAIVGSQDWMVDSPTIKGTVLNPTVVIGSTIVINGDTVTLTGTTVASLATDINTAAITGVTASGATGYLELFADNTAASGAGTITIANGTGTTLASVGITADTYNRPAIAYGTYVQIPSWRGTDASPRPSGSVYLKTTAIGAGANLVIKRYNAAAGTWTEQAAPLYKSPEDGVFFLDPAGGGANIAANSVWFRYDIDNTGLINFKPYIRLASGAVKTVAASVPGTFTSGDSFTITYTRIGIQAPVTSATISLATTSNPAESASEFVAKVLAANIPEVTAAVETNGAISLTHKFGGVIRLNNIVNTPIAVAGFNTGIVGVTAAPGGGIELTGFAPLTYTYSVAEPVQNPEDGALWYYSSATEVDILVNDLTGWQGYQNVISDSRGYNLSLTDPNGVIVSASRPTTQTDNTALAAGDLWLDTSDLENWPKLSRYDGSDWVDIDNTDQIGPNGIIFADARWGLDGTEDPVSGNLPSIVSMLQSDYVDLDAPDYRLYPRGTLLFNTRRSGYNVKRFVSDYFNAASFPSQSLPSVTDAWVSASGLKADGSMYAGRQAQRQMVVAALKAAIDGNTSVREDQFAFNLIAAPGYQELISNMVALNNDRANTAFVIGDTPFRLLPTTVDVANWSNNADNITGLTTNDPYLGVYYPGAALTNDVQGNSVVVPPSHIVLRTFLRNDDLSYPWFAPAGTRRGLVDNATSVGYIDPLSGEYNAIGVNQGLRDGLYENRINPITNLPGIGLVVWGQKTRNPTASSLDRVNVARLVNYIRTILASVGNGFLFEPNDKITRDQIKNIISGAMNDLVSKRGVYDYLVVCDDSNNTPARIARNELYVDIAIEPMKDVEFIYIPIRLFNPGDVARLGS